MGNKPLKYKNLQEVLVALEAIENNQVQTLDDWEVSKHLIHCAQAIEYSMNGYPILKPWLMQQTIGKLAFNVFRRRGYMRHNTNKLTPGAKEKTVGSLKDSAQFLTDMILRFDSFSDPFRPHEFYGSLSKKEYEQAHSMHIANHFEKILFIK